MMTPAPHSVSIRNFYRVSGAIMFIIGGSQISNVEKWASNVFPHLQLQQFNLSLFSLIGWMRMVMAVYMIAMSFTNDEAMLLLCRVSSIVVPFTIAKFVHETSWETGGIELQPSYRNAVVFLALVYELGLLYFAWFEKRLHVSKTVSVYHLGTPQPILIPDETRDLPAPQGVPGVPHVRTRSMRRSSLSPRSATTSPRGQIATE